MGGRTPAGRHRAAGQFRRDEAGAGTAFGLFGLVICMMIAGAAVDFSNAWRHREILRLSADVAAHAGVSVLARGGSRMAALAVATGATELNTPTSVYGRVIGDPFVDIQALHYDPVSNMVAPGDSPNAISVRLQRNDEVRNPVPTFLLRLIGQKSWNVSATSVATVVPTGRCTAANGIFARGRVMLDGQSVVGEGVCVHSQDAVALLNRTSFEDGSGLSMPDLADCQGNCSEFSSPGIAAAATEANLILPTITEQVAHLAEGFASTREALPEEEAFFADHPLDGDLSALEELGIDTADLEQGDVVSLEAEAAERARAFPAGLVYDVTCGAKRPGGVLTLGGTPVQLLAEMAEDVSSREGDGWDEVDMEDLIAPDDVPLKEMEAETAQKLMGMVLVTDCRVHLTDMADVQGSVLISTQAGQGASFTADPGARAGDPALGCDPARQSIFMGQGHLQASAGLTSSNAAFVMAGNIGVDSDPAGTPVSHRGLTLHAGGNVLMSGPHVMRACATAKGDLLPKLNVIRFVLPTDPLR